mmetsp:Transcript_20300/g.29363  ORF Transcript_20300/g.29363 Transcript_20300/m.29363 type:complete len:216 (-) Transcript_20300:249-896(-)
MEEDSQAKMNKIITADDAKSGFWSIVQSSLSDLMAEAPTVWKGPQADDYATERTMIQRNYTPIYWGIGSSLIVFATFRITGSQQYRHFLMRRRNLPIPLEDPTEAAKNRLMSLPIDLMLSLLIGVSATLFNIKTTVLQKDFETAPLVQGKSLVVKHFCPPMTHLHHRIDPGLLRKIPQDNTIESLKAFVNNCKAREETEAAIRVDQPPRGNDQIF